MLLSAKKLTQRSYRFVSLSGRPYIQSYKNAWVPKTKDKPGHSKTVESFHVGPVHDGNEVPVSEAFLSRFPVLAGKTWVWKPEEHDLVAEDQQTEIASAEQTASEENPVPSKDDEPLEMSAKHFLADWAINAALVANGSVKALEDVWDARTAHCFAGLAQNWLLDGYASADSFPEWAERHYLSKDAQSLDGQSISELYGSVTREKFELFWLEKFKRSQKLRDEKKLPKVRYCAFDSTSISTYSHSISDADFGHAKQNPELKQINLLTVLDELTGDIIYAYPYSGSVNDKASFKHLLDRMETLGFPMEEITLVTDRGYDSNHNLNACLQNGVNFICGYPIYKGGSLERFILSKRGELLDKFVSFDQLTGVHCLTINEKWKDSTGADVTVYAHVYKNERKAAEQNFSLEASVAKALDCLNKGKGMPDGCSKEAKSCLKKIKDPNSNPHKEPKEKWVCIDAEMERKRKLAGVFALRSNCLANASRALSHYRARGTIEQGFDHLKNGFDGDRLRVTDASYYGKILMFALAMGVRTRIRHNARNHLEANPDSKVRIPGDSVNRMFKSLDNGLINRRKRNQRWLVDPVKKEHQDWLAILFDVPLPPRSFW